MLKQMKGQRFFTTVNVEKNRLNDNYYKTAHREASIMQKHMQ